jgi:rubredoxin
MTRRKALREKDSRRGTPWSDIPDDWCCPDCAVREKVDFEEISEKRDGAMK